MSSKGLAPGRAQVMNQPGVLSAIDIPALMHI
jgi:hypothetical protein